MIPSMCYTFQWWCSSEADHLSERVNAILFFWRQSSEEYENCALPALVSLHFQGTSSYACPSFVTSSRNGPKEISERFLAGRSCCSSRDPIPPRGIPQSYRTESSPVFLFAAKLHRSGNRTCKEERRSACKGTSSPEQRKRETNRLKFSCRSTGNIRPPGERRAIETRKRADRLPTDRLLSATFQEERSARTRERSIRSLRSA